MRVQCSICGSSIRYGDDCPTCPNAKPSAPQIKALAPSVVAPIAKPKPADAPAPTAKRRIGRPKLEDMATTYEATKPWLNGPVPMCRASWYRRRQAKPLN
jgi:hypothetical protein